MPLKSSLLLCAILLSTALLGQKKFSLDGRLLDENRQGLEMANLLVTDAADSSIVTYGFSDSEGRFRLLLPPESELVLNISYLGYKSIKKSIKTGSAGEQRYLELTLEPDAELLNQIEVVDEMPIVVSGDTISYKADAFATGEEKKLEDVLKKLPGFEVDDDGQVKVEGKTVEKVMIEGQDVFDGDSKVATKNLPANAVDKVQVLRNYEEISPLQGLSSEDRIALNIKLKEGKKNLWFGDAEAKGGIPERYLLHGNAFYFSPKSSFNFIGDMNNIGKSAFTVRDYFRFSGGFRRLSGRSGFNLNFASDDLPIPLGQNNRAEEVIGRFGAANFSYKPRKDLRLSGFVIANNNDIVSPYVTNRTYIGADSLGSEQLTTVDQQNNTVALGKFSATYEPNDGFYLNYDLFTKLSDISTTNLLNSDFGSIDNQFLTRENQQPWSIQQNLEFFKNIDDDVLAIELQHLIKRQDPRLSLTGTTLPFNILDSSVSSLWQEQLINSQGFEGRASYYWVFNKNNHFEFNLGAIDNRQDFNSEILEGEDENGAPLDNETLLNDVSFRLTDIFGGLHYKTKWGKFTFRPGVNYHYYWVQQNYPGQDKTGQYGLLLPDALLRYEISKSQGFDLRYNMQANFFDVNDVINGLIIQNYNSLFTGSSDLVYSTQHTASLRYRNFNLFNFTTIFAGVNYSRTEDGIANQVDFILTPRGLQQVQSPINGSGFNQNLSGYAFYSKKFKWLRMDARLNLGYNTVNNRIDGLDNVNNTFTQSYRAGVGTNFKKWPNIEINYTFSLNQYSGSRDANDFSNHRPSVELSAVFLKNFTLRSDYSYNNYGQAGGTRTSFDFLNASLEFQEADSPWMFSVEGLNLLNTNFIREDGLTNNLISTTAYTVLPRYVLFGVRYDL